ncbi:MAG: FtsB family cell division protein [Christensenellaceae bacterium]|jgi:cell division protein DivIC
MEKATRTTRKENVERKEKQSFFGKLKGFFSLRLLVCVVFFIYAAISISTNLIKAKGQKARQQELLEQEATLAGEYNALQEIEGFIGSDEYIERMAREKLGWVKDDEILFKEVE